MTEDASQIGARLKKEREAAGLTQEEVAQLAGVQPTTVSRWERGERTPSQAVIRLLADAFKRGQTNGASGNVSRETIGLDRELPDAVWNREHEIEEELRKAGASPQQVRDFRQSVRESPLIAALFHGGAPKRVVTEAEMQLYEGVAAGFAAIVRQMLKEEKEAKRRG